MNVIAAAVLLTGDEAAYLAGALDELARLYTQEHAKPSPKLSTITTQLHRASQKCDAFARSATKTATKTVFEGDGIDDRVYGTCGTEQAAAILGVSAGAVRALARRGRLGSKRVGGRWRHDLAICELRAMARPGS